MDYGLHARHIIHQQQGSGLPHSERMPANINEVDGLTLSQ